MIPCAFAGYVAELVANWFIGSGLPLPITEKLLRQQDEFRKLKELESMDVEDIADAETKETSKMETESEKITTSPEEEDSTYKEIQRMYWVLFLNAILPCRFLSVPFRYAPIL